MNNEVYKGNVLMLYNDNTQIRNRLVDKFRNVCALIYRELVIKYIHVNNNSRRLLLKVFDFLLLNENIYHLISVLVLYGINWNKLTPGEEHASLKINFANNNIFTSKLSYVLFIALEKTIYELILKLNTKIKEYISSKNKSLLIYEIIETLIPSFNIIHQIETSYFLLNKTNNLNFIQKLFNISYRPLSTTNMNSDNNGNGIMSILLKGIGYMSLLKVVIIYIQKLKIFYNIIKKTYGNKKKTFVSHDLQMRIKSQAKMGLMSDKCVLCLDKFKYKSVTLCGHLFCWKCIFEYLHNNNNTCPKCRKHISLNCIILLRNY